MEILNLQQENYEKSAAGEKIFSVGEPADKIYLILKGEVGLFPGYLGADNKLMIDRIGAGKILGEMALLKEAKRNFKAVCLEDTIYVTLSRDDFRTLLQEKPEYNEKTILALGRRVSKLAQILKKGDFDVGEEDIELFDNHREDKSDANKSELTELHNFYLPEHGNYPQSAPEEFQHYLYEKKIECPVCGNIFTAKKVRNSRLQLEEFRDDLRKVFRDFKPSWYYIWACSECFYAAPRQEFQEIAKGHEKKIKNKFKSHLENKAEQKLETVYSSTRSLNEVFFAYYLSLALYEFIACEHDKPAGSWLRLSWLYEDVGETSLQKTAAHKAMENLKIFYYQEYSGSLSKNAEHKLTLLLAHLIIEYGDNSEKALPLLDELIRDGMTKKIYRELARDKFTSLRENRE